MAVASRALLPIEPVRLRAEVVHGFGRGSKQLGFPTANLAIRWDAAAAAGGSSSGAAVPPTLTEEEQAVLDFATNHATGIYCAFGCIEGPGHGAVHQVAMSMGWNPTFSDVKAKTIEPWILHSFNEDFYGHNLRLLVLGYVRPELKFESLEQLKREITADGEFCRQALEGTALASLAADPFLRPSFSQTAANNSQLDAPGAFSQAMTGVDLRTALQKLPAPRPGASRLLLVRHGETSANEQGFLCGGGNDSQLTQRGRAQAQQLAEELEQSGVPWLASLSLVASSTLSRARDSADAIARRFPGAARECHAELREMGYGGLEGSRISDVRAEMAAISQKWRAGETGHRIGGAGGESPEDVAARASAAVRAVVAARPPGDVVLLVCHSWVNKALIACATPGLGLARMQEVPQRNCAVNVLDVVFEGGAGGAPASFEVLAVDLLAAGPSTRPSEGRL